MPILAPLILAFAAAQPTQHAPIEGLWKNPIGSAIIAVAPCGNALCGKVVWASARGQREVAKTTSNVVEIYIHYLRDKLDRGAARPLIRTVRGVGYTLKP